MLHLVDAAASLEIARYFLEDEPFYSSLGALQVNPKLPPSVRHAIERLLARVNGWKSFRNSLDNREPEFAQSVDFLKDLASEEYSLGCWLVSMLNHSDLCAKFETEVPIPSSARALPRPLFRYQDPAIEFSEFLIFVKAFLGLSSVIAVWSWYDSIGIDTGRERALAILALWEDVEGYREVMHSLFSALPRPYSRDNTDIESLHDAQATDKTVELDRWREGPTHQVLYPGRTTLN